MLKVKCKECGKSFETYPSRVKTGRGKFCSRSCSCSFNMRGNKHNLGNTYWVGLKHSEESKRKISKSKKGQRVSVTTEFKKGLKPWNKGISFTQIAGDRHPAKRPEVAKAISLAKKGKPNFKLRGENNHRWKGGVTDKNKKIRSSIEYKNWRVAVFERDNYTCQHCGKRGGILNADHIKRFADYPELRLDLDNGQTLCEPCHKLTPTYGNRIMGTS